VDGVGYGRVGAGGTRVGLGLTKAQGTQGRCIVAHLRPDISKVTVRVLLPVLP
jgi:hypothetical protein